ncbi:olfactory receptor 5M11-like [Discoglossus pictus]
MLALMLPTNQTKVTYFTLKGISDDPDLQAPIFLLVLVIYLLTLGGNMTILLLVCLDPQLHTPMYFFLANLSMLDMMSTTNTLHSTLISFISGDKTISFPRCMAQMYIFGSLLSDELKILVAMSYDRYVAICNPLRYHLIMRPTVRVLLTTVCWVLGCLEIIPIMVVMSKIYFCSSKDIDHFFCDILPLIQLSCSDTSLLELLLFLAAVFHNSISFLPTLIPYVFIIITILRIPSRTGRRKAFYTCSSHITVVTLLYITLLCQYLKPTSMGSQESIKLYSLFNTAAVPLLNPLIYSLKNKDVKSALRRKLRWCQDKGTQSQSRSPSQSRGPPQDPSSKMLPSPSLLPKQIPSPKQISYPRSLLKEISYPKQRLFPRSLPKSALLPTTTPIADSMP